MEHILNGNTITAPPQTKPKVVPKRSNPLQPTPGQNPRPKA